MYKQQKILAVIPARGGSKGIPNKNIVLVKGRPLIDYTIAEALKSIYIDRVVVSTDSEKIAEVARNSGAEVPFLRSTDLAEDDSTIIDVMVDLIKNISNIEKEKYDYVVLLQPTQPLRKSFHIDEAIEKTVDNNYKSLLSINLVDDHPILIRSINKDGFLEKILDVTSTVRRQDFPDYYKVNGAIYINKVDELDSNTSLNDNVHPYIMESKYDLDIDEPEDLESFDSRLEIK